MPLPVLDTSSATMYVPLVTFKWGASSEARYCRATSNISIGNNVWIAEPRLEWVFDSALGSGTEDSPLTLKMPMSLPPMLTAALPFKHSKVEVILEELATSSLPGNVVVSDLESKTELFTGRMRGITTRTSGEDGMVNCKVVGRKADIKGTLGITAMTGCAWQFGDSNSSPCGKSLAPIRLSGTITGYRQNNIDNRILVTLAGSPDLANIRWSKGYVEFDGLKIIIRRSIDDGTHRFDLREMPPPSWNGAAVTLTPGCGKSLENCQYWNNESRFAGFGRNMPLRNPIFP